MAGEGVACCDVDGRVRVNGQALDEPYVVVNGPLDALGSCGTRRFDPVAVPEGQLFVMGDHRATADDSRCRGTLPATHVVALVDP